MLDLNKALSRLNAMTPQDIATLLKEALNESEIPYTTSSGKYTIEDFLSAFQDDLSIYQLEVHHEQKRDLRNYLYQKALKETLLT